MAREHDRRAKRIIVVRERGRLSQVMFNPVIVKKVRAVRDGGGLPVPHRHPAGQTVAVHQGAVAERKVPRAPRQDLLPAWTAEIIQHELDHCDGILI